MANRTSPRATPRHIASLLVGARLDVKRPVVDPPKPVLESHAFQLGALRLTVEPSGARFARKSLARVRLVGRKVASLAHALVRPLGHRCLEGIARCAVLGAAPRVLCNTAQATLRIAPS